jgi:hypothetical protein
LSFKRHLFIALLPSSRAFLSNGSSLRQRLPPRQPERDIHITVHHRRHGAPTWLIPLAILALLSVVSSHAPIVSCVLIAVFLTAHPTIAIALGGTLALVVIIALRERWYGRPF